MRLIGLTGGIGSGKSLVSGMFVTLGIPVYESDSRAKSIMITPPVRSKIISLLGPEAYKDNALNTSWIAAEVFADERKLEQLNAIVHPAVYKDLMNWAAEEQQAQSPYLLQESAILFEENLTARFEAIIMVAADQEERISRVIARDGVTRESVLKRMAHQWNDEKKIPLSDFVIFNDAGRSLITQVMDIDKMLRARITGG